jgi:hypothetical protein
MIDLEKASDRILAMLPKTRRHYLKWSFFKNDEGQWVVIVPSGGGGLSGRASVDLAEALENTVQAEENFYLPKRRGR